MESTPPLTQQSTVAPEGSMPYSPARGLTLAYSFCRALMALGASSPRWRRW